MPATSHRALRFILRLFSGFLAIAGLVLIFGNKALFLRLFLSPPESELSTLLLVMVKEVGGLMLMMSALCFFAARDPERNVAIIDGLIVGFCMLAVTPLLSLYTLDVRSLYPAYLIWGRAIGRLAFAGLLYYLRPREVPPATG